MAAKAPKAKAPEAGSGKAPSGKAAAAKDDAGGEGKRPNGLQQPLRPSAELAAVVGPDPLPRGEVVSKV
jgi:upstream activation factor subunit UAF30